MSLNGYKGFQGPEAGNGARFGHLRAPFGLYIELVSFPHGRAHEGEMAIAGWNPAQPDDVAVAALRG